MRKKKLPRLPIPTYPPTRNPCLSDLATLDRTMTRVKKESKEKKKKEFSFPDSPSSVSAFQHSTFRVSRVPASMAFYIRCPGCTCFKKKVYVYIGAGEDTLALRARARARARASMHDGTYNMNIFSISGRQTRDRDQKVV